MGKRFNKHGDDYGSKGSHRKKRDFENDDYFMLNTPTPRITSAPVEPQKQYSQTQYQSQKRPVTTPRVNELVRECAINNDVFISYFNTGKNSFDQDTFKLILSDRQEYYFGSKEIKPDRLTGERNVHTYFIKNRDKARLVATHINADPESGKSIWSCGGFVIETIDAKVTRILSNPTKMDMLGSLKFNLGETLTFLTFIGTVIFMHSNEDDIWRVRQT